MVIILNLDTEKSNQIIDITSLINKNITIESGIAVIYSPHTTAGLTINESADSDVKSDFLKSFNDIVRELDFKHMEGNSSSHVKTSITGKSLNIIIEKNRLKLGTWDGVYFCEFDGPRNRKIWLKQMSD
ncbi:MAG: secondary thiamine-phosphate synthase enzyme YjbQ [Thermoplasmatota archaeon]